MPKTRTIFLCTKCDSQYAKWQGRCTECGSWGTIAQDAVLVDKKGSTSSAKPASLVKLHAVAATSEKRSKTNISEIDRVLGGGLVSGSVYLLGGDPGVGKSTLLLQVAETSHIPTVYFSGEESETQVKTRVDRMQLTLSQMQFAATGDLASIIATLESERPALCIVDSIQTIRDDANDQPAGSQGQVRAVASQLIECAKRLKIAMFIIGHVTKGGAVAGPKTLEHLVDGVLYLEGEKSGQVRILRSVKNRFGSTDEIGVFEISDKGFSEARNPAKLFLGDGHQHVPGTAISAICEGSRIFFIEFQALLSRTNFGYPVRKCVGYDLNRLQMLVAVLQKRLALPLHQYDIHLNVIGGMKFADVGSDLGAALAIISALKNIFIPRSTMLFGEVGLGGEVRSVSNAEKRINEARTFEFTTIICPATKITATEGIVPVKHVREALDIISRQ